MLLEQVHTKSQSKFLSHLLKKAHQQRILILQSRDSRINSTNLDNCIQLQIPYQTSNQDNRKLNALMDEVKRDNNISDNDIYVSFKQMLSVGEKFPNFGKVHKVLEKGSIQMNAKEGQIMVVVFWSTWCEPCVQLMESNEKMMRNNKWREKVKIYAINMDNMLKQVRDFLKQKRWKHMQHLTIGGWNQEHALMKSFAIANVPFSCIVDPDGTIYWLQPYNIENKIKQLLKEPQVQNKTQQKTQQNRCLSSQQIAQVEQVLTDKQMFWEKFGKCKFFANKICLNSHLKQEKITHYAQLQIFAYEQDKHLFEQYEKLIPIKDIKIMKIVIPTIKVPEIGKYCSQCKKQLKYPLYWCYWEKDKADFRCRACVEKKQNQKQYNYKQNSILLVEETEQIQKQNLGQNIQPESTERVTKPHTFVCSSCRKKPKQIGQPRYICLACSTEPAVEGRVDLCYQCSVKYLEDYQSIKKGISAKHHHRYHPFVRVLYNVNGVEY